MNAGLIYTTIFFLEITNEIDGVPNRALGIIKIVGGPKDVFLCGCVVTQAD